MRTLMSKTLLVQMLFFITPLLLLKSESLAQTNDSSKLSNINLYVDAGFLLAGQVSLNLEKRIHAGDKVTWYARAGLCAAGVIMVDGGLGGLIAITMLSGKGKNHFELNGGVFFIDSKELFPLPLIDLGYRHQKPGGGFIFKAKAGILGIGIGLGYAF
jgi:hypothetical protein